MNSISCCFSDKNYYALPDNSREEERAIEMGRERQRRKESDREEQRGKEGKRGKKREKRHMKT